MKLKDLPVGSLVKDPKTKYLGAEIIFRIVAKNHPKYPANSVTLITDRVIAIKAFDAKESRNSSFNRSQSGNARYRYSNIRQWLNKSGPNWFVPQHSYDEPPIITNLFRGNDYSIEPGFLTDFSDAMKENILDTKFQVRRTAYDGGDVDELTDKVFLPSDWEVYGESSIGKVVNDARYEYFSSYDKRAGLLTPEAIANYRLASDDGLKPNQELKYWTRTPYLDYMAYKASPSAIGSDTANTGSIGIRPVINLPDTIEVLGSSDVYDLNFISISPKSKHLGEVDNPNVLQYQGQSFTGTITVKEKVNGQLIGEKTIAANVPQNFVIPDHIWNDLAFGDYDKTTKKRYTIQIEHPAGINEYQFRKAAPSDPDDETTMQLISDLETAFFPGIKADLIEQAKKILGGEIPAEQNNFAGLTNILKSSLALRIGTQISTSDTYDVGAMYAYPVLQVTGIGFKPKFVIIIDEEFSPAIRTTTIYLDFDIKNKNVLFSTSQAGYGTFTGYNQYVKVENDMFSLPVNSLRTNYLWIAIG